MAELIKKIASDQVLDTAYYWLCKRRQDYSHNNDVWDLRRQWQVVKPLLQKTLLSGEYTFSPLSEISIKDETIRFWSAQDALVLKAMTIVLGELPVFDKCCCYHLAGKGGTQKAVRAVFANLTPDAFVMKSDVKSYYASINHEILYGLAEQYVPDIFVLRLLWLYMKRTVCYGGLYKELKKGISFRCSLSPLMGALYLKPLDDRLRETGLFYALYMDDWVIIAPTRWKIRNVVRIVNKVLNELRIEIHPAKTFIGRVSRGFDFLGYFIRPGCVEIAQKTWTRFFQRIGQLYEQGADHNSVGRYVKHWKKWLKSGIDTKPILIILLFSSVFVSANHHRPIQYQVIEL